MTKNDLRKIIKKEITNFKKDFGEVNLMISGGVDSGVLAALSKPEHLFTVHLPFGHMHDEFNDMLRTIYHLGLRDELVVVELNLNEFDDVMKEAVKIIGRPIPHYNIFPLFCLFREMNKQGVKHAMSGDGPDESMCGYTRHLIMNYLYKSKELEAFKFYRGMIDKILGDSAETYAKLVGKDVKIVKEIMAGRPLLESMCKVDMELMRPDMDNMSDRLAEHFKIKIHRPYQDNTVVDNLMFSLPEEQKVVTGHYGKLLLRELASDLLPEEIAWREQKIGGPLIPVNKIKGWDLPISDKSMYLKYQEDILNG